jgi:RHS repeat-associated protein
LCEIDANDPDGSLTNSYTYANGQILCQKDGPVDPNRYFYVHDRLGSVRLVVDKFGDIMNSYTYDPAGLALPQETYEKVYNPFLFTGQWFDPEIQQYYLRARMYDPRLGVFTSRDPVMGQFKEPMTLHTYLYCRNNLVNLFDPSGNSPALLVEPIVAGYSVHMAALAFGVYGVASENERFLTLCLAMEKTVGPIVLLAFGSVAINDNNQQVIDNYSGDPSRWYRWMPKWVRISMGLVYLSAQVGSFIGDLRDIEELPTAEDWDDIQPRWELPPDEQEPPYSNEP